MYHRTTRLCVRLAEDLPHADPSALARRVARASPGRRCRRCVWPAARPLQTASPAPAAHRRRPRPARRRGARRPRRAPASGLQSAGAPPAAAAAERLQPFAEVIKRRQAQIDGLFTLWQKRRQGLARAASPEDFNQPFFLSPKLATGIGEARFFGGLMDDAAVVEFRRVHNQVQMICAQHRLRRQGRHARRPRGRGGVLAEPAGERARC